MSVIDAIRKSNFQLGFVTALGVLVAVVIGFAAYTVSSILILTFAAFFIGIGLAPAIAWMRSKGVKTSGALLIVTGVFLAFSCIIVFFILPVVWEQATNLVASLPSAFREVQHQDWYLALDPGLKGMVDAFLEWVVVTFSDPKTWSAIAGGALHVGSGLINGVLSILILLILTLHFVVALPTIKKSFYSVVSASRRATVVDITEQITDSVGRFLRGQVLLALINATFTFTFLTILRVPSAFLLAALAFPITMIPLIGSVISTTIIVTVCLFTSPSDAVIALIVMIVYMQVESMVLTPKIIGNAVNIPPYFVILGCLIGGTLLGLLGVLISGPVIAAILLIIRATVVPKQAVA